MRKPSAILTLLGLALALTLLASSAGAQVVDETDRPADDQITRLYQAVFDRPADAGGFAFWTEQYRSTGSLSGIAAQFTDSQEFIDRYGSNPTNAALVDAMYTNVLDRDGDEDGVRFWLDQLDTGAISQVGLLLAFADSDENIERTGTSQPLTAREAQLLRLYRSAFGRFPDAGGFAFWMGEYTASTPLRDIALRFSQSPEFTDIYGTSPRPSELVDRLYLNVLDRSGEAAGVTFWEGDYVAGRSVPELLVAFADSDENVERTGTATNPATVAAVPTSITLPIVQNMVLPDGTCGLTNDTGRQLIDGLAGPGDFGEEISLADGGVGLADLNADGATDAVIAMRCFGGGNAEWSDTVIWLSGRGPGSFDFNLHEVVDVRGITSVATTRTSADVGPGLMQISWFGASSIDSACCPSSQVTTEISVANGRVVLRDTLLNGPELNAIRVIKAAVVGGSLPANLPVAQDVWDELSGWLAGTAVDIDDSPCFVDAGDAITCLFATPELEFGIAVFISMAQVGPDEMWSVTAWEGVIHAS